MVPGEALLVTLVKLIDLIPMPATPAKRQRGHPQEYTDRLMLKALVIMIVRRLYSAYSLLAFLEQESDLTIALRSLLMEQGRFPTRRTWERRLAGLPRTLPSLIACLGAHLVAQIKPWGQDGRATTIDSTALRATGRVWHTKDLHVGIVTDSTI